MGFLADPAAVQLQAKARLALRRRRSGAPAIPASFGDWLKRARPEYEWTAPHFVAMQDVLDQVTAGELRRIYFQVPIRHGKTEHNTIGYAVYRLERNPRTRILVGSYNERRAQKFS